MKNDNYNLRILDMLSNNLNFILDNPYINGMGYGLKTVNGKQINVPTLTFLVEKKLPNGYIEPKYRIPEYINNVLTDVLVDGNHTLCADTTRPAYASMTLSNIYESIDTRYSCITCAVTENDTRKNLYALSTLHAIELPPPPDRTVICPAKIFGGVAPTPNNKNNSYIGTITKVSPFVYAQTPNQIRPSDSITIDACLTLVGENTVESRKKILSPYFYIGKFSEPLNITQTTPPKLNEKIWFIPSHSKHRTYGTITLTDVVRTVKFYNLYTLFSKQVLVTNLSTPIVPGDSGSLGLYNDNSAFGMLISSDGTNSGLFTPIDSILNYFKIDFVLPGDGITE